MEEALVDLISSIHSTHIRTVLCVTGAGSQAIAWLLGVPGASKTVLEATVPYSTTALSMWLGEPAKSACSAQMAKRMAHRAFERAVQILERESEEQGLDVASSELPVALGVACTASIVSNRVHRGEHRCYIAAWRKEGCTMYHLELDKERHRSRLDEEAIVSRLVIKVLAEGCGILSSLDIPVAPTEQIETTLTHFPSLRSGSYCQPIANGADTPNTPMADSDGVELLDPLTAVCEGKAEWVLIPADAAQQPVLNGSFSGIIIPGSFNPLHEGHEKLAEVALKHASGPVAFEITVNNADKPALEEHVVRKRVAQMRGKYAVLVTRTALFSEKCRMFPGSTFVIGTDTMERILNPVYYGGSDSGVADALHTLRIQGCRFLVAGRVDAATGLFKTSADVPVPSGEADLFAAIPPDQFRVDVSSTQLRASGVHL